MGKIWPDKFILYKQENESRLSSDVLDRAHFSTFRHVESGRRGSEEKGVDPRLSQTSHGTTLVTPLFPSPSQRSASASWRQCWVSSPAEGLLQSISGMKKMTIFLRRLFFQVRGSERKETITRGVKKGAWRRNF